MPLTSSTKLGPYEIHSSIGAGGMGEVYRARDTRLGRDVAIKVLPESFSADRDRMERFAQEARAAAALNHPNILSIFDVGDQSRTPYVVSELLEGETLRDRLKGGALPMRKAIDYALQVARGLTAAHGKGIVHRDLKPENLFITQDGRVKILDFGLAKLTRPEATEADATLQALTEPGLVMGTVGYMSPEQVRGKAADHRSDIFSFGAILYEMISGERAFKGETPADTMSAILKEEPAELSETVRNVPPALERIVRHCLEKNPAQRFQSAGDLAFGLEALTDISSTSKSGVQPIVETKEEEKPSSSKFAWITAGLVLVAAAAGLGWWIGRGGGAAPPPEYKQITFRTGFMGNSRFMPDGSIVYDASWEGGEEQLYLTRTDDTGSRPVGLKQAEILSISKNGELAVRLNTVQLGGYSRAGTLARMSLNGGSPREVLDNVQDADWAADGENMAVVRVVPETHHWRLEYPVGKVLIDGIAWLSHPKISPDGKSVAFEDHESPGGDDQGSVAVIGQDGKEKKLSSGWSSVEGILWAPGGDEIWFSGSNSGASDNMRGVTLSGKLRTIANVPGGMWLQDWHNGVLLMNTNQERLKIRGLAPGAKDEVELGWLGWSYFRDMSRDGKKILFEEEADGGGPNYTVYLRDTDGSPPVRISEGEGRAISPDGKWVITKPLRAEILMLVPTGAGQARPLTHDNISYETVRYLPDGKHLLASGIEPGHGVRNYLIDANTGDAKPVSAEGVTGVMFSPDGRETVVRHADGSWAIAPVEGGDVRPIPGLGAKYSVAGWTPDGASLLVFPSNLDRAARVSRVNIATGKIEFWREFGEGAARESVFTSRPTFSVDNKAYVYIYDQVLSEGYVVKGLK